MCTWDPMDKCSTHNQLVLIKAILSSLLIIYHDNVSAVIPGRREMSVIILTLMFPSHQKEQPQRGRSHHSRGVKSQALLGSSSAEACLTSNHAVEEVENNISKSIRVKSVDNSRDATNWWDLFALRVCGQSGDMTSDNDK